jgi:hypothetical protein
MCLWWGRCVAARVGTIVLFYWYFALPVLSSRLGSGVVVFGL